MRICYLILAEERPEQLARLVARLDGPEAAFVVHLEAKRDLAAVQRSIPPTSGELRFLDHREVVRPGSYAAVAAALGALEFAMAEVPSGYYVLLTDLDYPIRTDQQLRDELTSGAIYADVRPVDAQPEVQDRLDFRYRPTRTEHGLADRLVNELVLGALGRRDVARALGGRSPFVGSPWWALPAAAAEAVLAFVAQEDEFVRFFRQTRHPEELMVPTVIAALPRERVIRPSLTFVHSARAAAEGGRTTLHSGDLELLRTSGRCFAHGFDAAREPEVLDLVDRTLLADLYDN